MERFCRRSKFAPINALVLLVFCLCTSLATHAAEPKHRQAYIITLQHQLPETLIPVIKPMLAEQDSITGFGNELIITTSENHIKNIRQVVQRLDTPLHNLLITVRNNDSNTEQKRGQSIGGSITREHIRIDTGEAVPMESGVHISSDGLTYSAQNTQQRYTTRAEQQIRTVEGQPAFIYTGESRFIPTHDHDGHPDTLQVDALQGLYVTVRLSGTRAILTIQTSDDTFASGGKNPETIINAEQLSTTVSGPLNEWINLGGLSLGGNTDVKNQVKKTTTRSDGIGNIAVKITVID